MAEAVQLAADLVNSSTPQLVAFAIGAIAGALVPTYYAQERLRGFGRALFSRLPYAPPPGLDRDQAMRAATDDVGDEDRPDDGGGE